MEEDASREAATLPAFAESSGRVPGASFDPAADHDAVEHSSPVYMSQPAAADGAYSQSSTLHLSYASGNEEFVIVDLNPASQQFHQHYEHLPEPGLPERLLRVTAATTQTDDDTDKIWAALKDRDRRIEELERRIGMQQAEITRIKHDMAACRRECAEQISSHHLYNSEAQLSQRKNNEGTVIKQSRPLHLDQLSESAQSEGFEIARFEPVTSVHSSAERNFLLPSLNTVGCEESAGVQIRQEVAAYRQECENHIFGLRERLEASCFELRLQCSAYVTALERRLRETMSAEHETMLSCFKEMTLLRDYVTSMTDVIETIVSLYEPSSDSTRPITDTGKVSKSDTAK